MCDILIPTPEDCVKATKIGDMLGSSCDSVTGGLSFEIMLDRKAFLSIPNSLEVVGDEVVDHYDQPQSNVLEV